MNFLFIENNVIGIRVKDHGQISNNYWCVSAASVRFHKCRGLYYFFFYHNLSKTKTDFICNLVVIQKKICKNVRYEKTRV